VWRRQEQAVDFNTYGNKAADFSAALFSVLEAPDLPARAGSKSDTYATRSNTNADAGATIVVAVVVSATVVIALARSIVIAITVFLLNDDASTATRAVAAATLIADQSNIFDTAIR
jgi:hypothetical protein